MSAERGRLVVNSLPSCPATTEIAPTRCAPSAKLEAWHSPGDFNRRSKRRRPKAQSPAGASSSLGRLRGFVVAVVKIARRDDLDVVQTVRGKLAAYPAERDEDNRSLT
jgi:hypothetical protein